MLSYSQISPSISIFAGLLVLATPTLTLPSTAQSPSQPRQVEMQRQPNQVPERQRANDAAIEKIEVEARRQQRYLQAYQDCIERGLNHTYCHEYAQGRR